MLVVPPPILHVPPVELPLNTTLPPEQNVVLPPAVIADAVGRGLTITETFCVLLPHPLVVIVKA